MNIAFSIAFAVAAMMGIEYAAHRWGMHSKAMARRFGFLRNAVERHAVLHHGRFYRERFDHDPDPVARHFNIDLDPGFALLVGSPATVCLWFAGFHTTAVALAVVSAGHAVVWSLVHREMHDPRGRWFSQSRYYRFVREAHRVHHERPGRNFAVVFPPFVDILFGTWRRP